MRGIEEGEEQLLISACEALTSIERDGKRPRALVDLVWRAIAANILDDADTARWARRIAKDVVANILDDKSFDRDDRALKALGLFGQGQDYAPVVTAMEQILAFENLAKAQDRLRGEVSKVEPLRHRRRRLLTKLRAYGHFQNISDQSALKRIHRILEKLPHAS